MSDMEQAEHANEEPARRRGRAPGSPKVPGSGRKAGGRNHVSRDAKADVADVLDRNAGVLFQRLASIALGRKIRIGDAAGPNPQYIYPSETSQMKALDILARKLRPDLAATQLTGKDGGPIETTTNAEMPLSPRDTARTILGIFREAVAEQGGDVKFGFAGAGEALLRVPAEDRPFVGGEDAHTDPPPTYYLGHIETFDNGAQIRLVEISGSLARKWEVTDAFGVFHSYRRSREDAAAVALALPGLPSQLNEAERKP